MTLNKEMHKNIMLKILQEIFKNKKIGPHIAFKGGTALLLFYNLNRFSVDLDFDILDPGKVDFIFENMRNLLENFGELKEADNKSKGLFFSLNYEGKEEGNQNLKFDFSKKSFGIPSKYEIRENFGVMMNVMVQEDMAANKMAAMHERGETTNRDIFDVWFMLKKGWPVNRLLLKSRSGLEYEEFLKESIKRMEGATDRKFLAGLGELVEDEKQKVWVKTRMREELLFLLRLALDNEEKIAENTA